MDCLQNCLQVFLARPFRPLQRDLPARLLVFLARPFLYQRVALPVEESPERALLEPSFLESSFPVPKQAPDSVFLFLGA